MAKKRKRKYSKSSGSDVKNADFNFPAHRNLRVSEGVENLLR